MIDHRLAHLRVIVDPAETLAGGAGAPMAAIAAPTCDADVHADWCDRSAPPAPAHPSEATQ